MSYGTPPGTEGESTGGFPQGSGGPAGYEGQTVPPEQYGGAPGQQAPAPGQPYGGAPGQYGAPGPYGGAPGYGAPGYGAPGPYGTPPPAYRAWAITAAVFGVLFNLILGFPAALIASRHGRRVRAQWEAGDQQGAIKSSRRARTWAIVATVLDALGVILLVLIIAAGVSSQSDYHNPSVVAASIKTLLQKRISDPSSPYYSPGLTVTSVVCTSSGTNTDSCVDHFSNGQSASETAVISANGQHFVTR